LIYAAKYHGRWTVNELLADQLFAQARVRQALAAVDLLAFIPMTRSAQRARGYNQAELLARRLAHSASLPITTALQRVKGGSTQVRTPSRAQRQKNVRGAFEARATQILIGKRVMLVDDVTTTGATLRSAARALLRGGAAEVRAIVVSVADPLGRGFTRI
jgi:ComF family protein